MNTKEILCCMESKEPGRRYYLSCWKGRVCCVLRLFLGFVFW